MSDHSSDPQLDAQLRGVPLDENFLDRMKAALVPSDELIDRRLRDVRVPSSLAARLHALPDDVALEQRIVAVSPPGGLVQRLYAIAQEPIPAYRTRTPARRSAEAAGLFVSLSLGLAAAMLLIVSGVYPTANAELQIASKDRVFEMPTITVAAIEESLLQTQGDLDSQIQSPSVDSDASLQPQWTSLESANSTLVIDEATGDLLVDARDSGRGPVGEWTALSHGGLRMMDDIVLLKFGVLGSPQYTNDILPEFESPWLPTPRGVEPPLVRGYDRVFFLKNRVSPPISPGAHPALQTLAAPLTFDTRSYRHVVERLQQGRLPSATEIRVEDFLAAIDYRWPDAPPGALALRTAAGPSPFGAAGTGLLQVGVHAGSIKRETKRSTHLVLAIDASTSMGRAGRWTEVSYAVNRTLGQLTADDHLSLVVFQNESAQRWENIRRDEAAAIARELEQFQPSGGSNLPLGLQQAVSVAMSQELTRAPSRRIVLITDDPAAIPTGQRDLVRALLDSAGEAEIALDVIDMGETDRPASLLAELTSELEGDLRRLTDGRSLYWMLLERLAGQSSVVASEAKLTIRFNPQAVAAYRLIGHEANALAGLSPPSLESEIHATDTTTALIELWLQPGDADDVGEATVTWLDPQTGESRKRTQRISRLQFAPTFSESAPSLQAAAVAAEAAELLRGSRESLRQANPALPKASWDMILATAGEGNTVLRQWSDYRRTLQLIERADELTR